MASVPYVFECDKSSGFVMDPNEHKRVGYVTSLKGFGLAEALAPDLKVSIPFHESSVTYTGLKPVSSGPTTTVQVVGVFDKFSWDGSVGGALELDFWSSQANAFQIKALQQTTLKSTLVDPLGWWICDFDQESNRWYEVCYPRSTAEIKGVIANKENPELTVDLQGAPVKDGIDIMVYKISMKVVPAANLEHALHVANSATTSVVKQWGLVVGAPSATMNKSA
jgi:hypothetical protein